MADLPTDLDLVSASQAQKEVSGNALWSAQSTAKVFGRREGTSGGLVWGYYGGIWALSSVPTYFAAGVLTLTANATNYIYMDPSSSPAELTCSTSKPTGWPGPIAGGVVACYEVTVGPSSATAWRDWRLGIGTPGTAGSTGATGATGAAGSNGTNGTNGTDGAYGGAVTFGYTFNSSTSVADPGSGKMALNNATETSATILSISDTADVGSVATVLDITDDSTSTVKGYFRLYKKSAVTSWLEFSIASMTTHAGWREYAVTNVGGSGGSALANNDVCLLSFSRTGDAGATGATGATGSSVNPRIQTDNTVTGTKTLDCTSVDVFIENMTGSTLFTITNGVEGKIYRARLVQPAGGGCSATFDASVHFGADISGFASNTGANKWDYIAWSWNAITGKADFVSYVRGF